MIDHLSLTVADLARGRAFYDRALAPLGFHAVYADATDVAYGPHTRTRWPVDSELARFWISTRGVVAANGSHVALRARSGAAVDAFHAAGVSAGGTCDGPPGIRAKYHPGYYAAFVLDPDGNKIETVCHYGAGATARWRTLLAARSASEVAAFVRTKAPWIP